MKSCSSGLDFSFKFIDIERLKHRLKALMCTKQLQNFVQDNSLHVKRPAYIKVEFFNQPSSGITKHCEKFTHLKRLLVVRLLLKEIVQRLEVLSKVKQK